MNELDGRFAKVSDGAMKRIVFLGVAMLALLAQAEDKAGTNTFKRIGTADSDKQYDETCIVTGKVAQVTIKEKLVFLNIDKAFPESPFTGVIFAKSTNQFGDLKALMGKSVELQGKITEHKDKPEIVLESSNQLRVVTAPIKK